MTNLKVLSGKGERPKVGQAIVVRLTKEQAGFLDMVASRTPHQGRPHTRSDAVLILLDSIIEANRAPQQGGR